MKIKINFWAFVFSFVCIAMFFIATSSSEIVDFSTNLLHVHPLNIVLGMSIFTCLLGFIGFYEATNWKKLLRSILTIVITFGLSAFIIYILILGNLFKFT